ncbi:ankyrin repeat domain-containing protein [Flavobacterium sp. AC]|uniref:Ankyrin repeat domain-containing protein n=1 Tax=Flavobacterium azizsancarii TaxID=2961580 RepID=A0ABT4WJG0_9FLAO|nr:ankyrin repeat domain-containing protein [Flavobacterium azizsancarii]MDA6072596.1 ankyrin repeat domain-containing protein [Flavobacterium azizsancarii]
MKKSLIILAMVLAISTNASEASNLKLSVKDQTNYRAYAYAGSPLHYAVCEGDIENVKKLIKYGVNVNLLSNDMSPLMLAARFNKFEIIRILLANGADPSMENEKGYKALKFAEFAKASESIAILENLK